RLQLLRRLAAAIRHDHALHLRAQLEVIESLAGRFSHYPQALVDGGRPPSAHVGDRAATGEGDAREIYDVGLFPCQREQARTVAADDDGRVRSLGGKRMDRMARDAIVLADEVDLGPAEQALDDGNRLGQPLDPDAAAVEAESSLLVFDPHVA